MPRAPKDESKQDGAKGGNDATQDARLHGEMLMNSLLAFLKSSNAYGYELAQRMTKAGLGAFDTGAMYRMLRQLEASGFVSSTWDTGESGPARRVYSLTAAGEAFLKSWMGMLQAYQAVIQQAMAPFGTPAHKTEDESSDSKAD